MKNKIKKFLKILFLVVFIISITYILSYFYTYHKDKNDLDDLKEIMKENLNNKVETTKDASQNIIQNNQELNTIDEEFSSTAKDSSQEGIVNFKEIKKINNDIVAWVRIDNTDIDYPILQAKDNDYYLDRNYKKEYSVNGSIFLDYRYDFSKENQVFLVYGHNNNDRLMFNELLKYENKDFFEKNKKIELITEKEIAIYNIVSVFKSEVYGKEEKNSFKYYNYVDLSNIDEFDYYVQNIKNKSIFEINENIEYGDELLVLSTCEYSKPNGRFVVVAKKQE